MPKNIKRKVIIIEHQKHDDAIWATLIKVMLPRSVVNQDGNFIGLDGLKNDLRSVENITVVKVEDSRFLEDRVITQVEIKFNMRLSSKMPDHYIVEELIPNIKRTFQKGIDNTPSSVPPRLIGVSRAYQPKKKNNAM